MKARALKKLLDNTNYIVADHGKYIAVGSSLCHDLFSVNKETLALKYALDFDREGRAVLERKSSPDLRFIWDTLQGLIDSGEIHDIINGDDVIENPLPVYAVKDGELIETYTDAYGWPNLTVSGVLMHDNTYFKTKQEAIEKGISEYNYAIEANLAQIEDLEEKLGKAKGRMRKHEFYIRKLTSQLTNHPVTPD